MNNLEAILLVIILILLLIIFYLVKIKYKFIGGTQYIFDTNTSKLSEISYKNKNDTCCKYMMNLIINKFQNEKRYFLIDTTKRKCNPEATLINDDEHALLNLRNKIDYDKIKYISTIEFNENYEQGHCCKSLVSDCVNMAVIIQPEIFTNEFVLDHEITNEILPFKNIHFNYRMKFFKRFSNESELESFLNKEIRCEIYNLYLKENKLYSKMVLNQDGKFKNIFESFEFIFNEVHEFNTYLFNFDKNGISLIVCKIKKPKNYNEYVKYCMTIHMSYNNNLDNDRNVLNNYKETLKILQSKSNYMLKLFNIDTLNETNLQIVLKNKNCSCPQPDCFMIEFK